jgi:hypothetical protein
VNNLVARRRSVGGLTQRHYYASGLTGFLEHFANSCFFGALTRFVLALGKAPIVIAGAMNEENLKSIALGSIATKTLCGGSQHDTARGADR